MSNIAYERMRESLEQLHLARALEIQPLLNSEWVTPLLA
jgi:hypothetical protein